MPRGGKRLGSGRKPHTRSERWLGGNAGKRPLALVTARPEVGQSGGGAPAQVPESPSVLTDEEATYWALWAPMAVGRGMLHEETKPGFVLLCQQARRAALLWSDIDARGLVYEKIVADSLGNENRELKAHPLLGHWRALMARVEQLQARYGIAADGKVSAETPDWDTEETQLAKLLSVK